MNFSSSGKTDAILIIPGAGASQLTASRDIYQFNSGDINDPYLRYKYGTGEFFDSESNLIIAADGNITGSHFLLRNDEYKNIKFPLEAIRLHGSNDPDYAQYKTNGGGSTGVYLYFFDKDTDQEVHLSLQLPYEYSEGKDIIPYVEWVPTDEDNGKVIWGLEYTKAKSQGTFGNTTIVYTTGSPVDQDKMVLTKFSAIGDSGMNITSNFICRFFRAATEDADTYDNDAGVIVFGFLVPVNTLGSKTTTTK